MTDAELDQCRHDGALLFSIVSRKMKLKRQGHDWVGLCPFHAEKTSSFTVFPDGHFHCFGCNVHGTVFDFIMQTERVDFPAAKERVAIERGIASSKPRAQKPNGNGADHDEIWLPIVPPPADAPKPSEQQLQCDTLFEYPAANDRLLCYVRRFEAKGDRRKLFLPLSFGVLNGKLGWHDKAPATPRPLYGLNRLSHAAPDEVILLCEGEKAADAAQRLFPDHVAMSWMGGAAADGGADLSPLQGRYVILWPDADKPGRDVMARIAKRIPLARILDTDDLSDGFDAADLEHNGCDDPAAWLRARLHDPYDGLASALMASTWLSRSLPRIDRLLGDFITTTTRAFLVGQTGLGKTMLGLAFAMGIGFGTGFLHWRSNRPARVLYLDGEMPAELLIQRLRDAARRIGREGLIDNVMVLSTEDAEEIAEQWPMLGMFEPLNTDGGHDFIKRLCTALKPDVIILDNVQALLVGVQKDEETWIPVLPLGPVAHQEPHRPTLDRPHSPQHRRPVWHLHQVLAVRYSRPDDTARGRRTRSARDSVHPRLRQGSPPDPRQLGRIRCPHHPPPR